MARLRCKAVAARTDARVAYQLNGRAGRIEHARADWFIQHALAGGDEMPCIMQLNNTQARKCEQLARAICMLLPSLTAPVYARELYICAAACERLLDTAHTLRYPANEQGAIVDRPVLTSLNTAHDGAPLMVREMHQSSRSAIDEIKAEHAERFEHEMFFVSMTSFFHELCKFHVPLRRRVAARMMLYLGSAGTTVTEALADDVDGYIAAERAINAAIARSIAKACISESR